MEPTRWTDYLAVIPVVHGADLADPNPRANRELFLNLPNPPASKPGGMRTPRHDAVADFSLLALVFTTLLVVATVVLNWSR